MGITIYPISFETTRTSQKTKEKRGTYKKYRQQSCLISLDIKKIKGDTEVDSKTITYTS
jgi:hypothetical protein